jgi:hypothetical protein
MALAFRMRARMFGVSVMAYQKRARPPAPGGDVAVEGDFVQTAQQGRAVSKWA